MKRESLHQAINMLDDNLIQKTDALRNKKSTKKATLIRWVALAASFCLAITGAVVWGMWDSAPDHGSLVAKAQDLMEGVTPNNVSKENDLTEFGVSNTDFALRLFKASLEEGKNTLISPLSVLSALSMTANGADGDTLAQMEQALGMPIDKLNRYYYSYMSALGSDKNGKLSLANSIWFTDKNSFSVNKDFLQTNADYFGASAYKAPFDQSTLEDINSWVNKNTDGMIPKILDEIPSGAVMYLVNALAFDAEWQKEYEKSDILGGKFNTVDGRQVDAKYMTSVENTFLQDEKATGFIKYYKGNKYALAALLPNEGVSLLDYINTLDGESLNKLLSTRKNTSVYAALPKFETNYDIELNNPLKAMGMTDAFDSAKSNFSRIGSAGGNLYISRVVHKTFISVSEKGTKAGAATGVEIKSDGAIITDHSVFLDRPFIYMLIDCGTNTPFFIGTMNDVTK